MGEKAIAYEWPFVEVLGGLEVFFDRMPWES